MEDAKKWALERFTNVKELCDKHGEKINRKHVYGGALIEHFDVVCQALAEQPAQQQETINGRTVKVDWKAQALELRKLVRLGGIKIAELEAELAEQPAQQAVALHEVGLTRDINGVCIVTVNGREAIRDSSDIISHFATLDWFASDSLKKHFTKELVLSKKPERDCDSMEVCLYNRGWNDAIDSKLYTSPPAQRKPLTDEELDKCLRQAKLSIAPAVSFRTGFRAAEAAHGIKENT